MTLPHLQVLIVDDDVDIRETLADVLEDRGFSTILAANGLEALQLLRKLEVRPAVILLDLMMPIMDGYQFLDEREKDASLASIPVAILTAGHDGERDRIGNRALVVPKPINLLKLVNLLHDLRPGAAPWHEHL